MFKFLIFLVGLFILRVVADKEIYSLDLSFVQLFGCYSIGSEAGLYDSFLSDFCLATLSVLTTVMLQAIYEVFWYF